MEHYDYCIIGAGLAGAGAIDGIRSVDPDGSIALFGAENRLPYDRPPLSKSLWFGKRKLEDIYVTSVSDLQAKKVGLYLNSPVLAIDQLEKVLQCGNGLRFSYRKLLLAQGGRVRPLSIPGRAQERMLYLRTVTDYQRIRAVLDAGGKRIAVVGGGFIGSEMAAALASQPDVQVTHILSGPGPLAHVLPSPISSFLTKYYGEHGVRVLHGTRATGIERMPHSLVLHLASGTEVEADYVLAGIGITPETTLAQAVGLQIQNGVVVDETQRTSEPDIYAAGDLARYPDPVTGKLIRVEHWDNAKATGFHAGRNMAGANEPFFYQSMFFSDLFDLGFEAVGELDSRLETFADWEEEFRKGVIYYLRDNKVAGVLLWNVWDKVDEARAVIAEGKTWQTADLKGLIR